MSTNWLGVFKDTVYEVIPDVAIRDAALPPRTLARTITQANNWGEFILSVEFDMLNIEEVAISRARNLRALVEETALHECAHVLHIRTLIPAAQMAVETMTEEMGRSGLTPPPFPAQAFWALREVGRGYHSAHGPAWQKFARMLGCPPRARVR